MADILFITPSLDAENGSDSVGTYLLSTVLRENGLDNKILSLAQLGALEDFSAFLDQATRVICAEQPKIISFYTRCDNYHIILSLCKRLKQHTDAYIVLGGPQADLTAYETITSMPFIDFICCGEGETTVYPLFHSLLDKKPDLNVPGLVYMRDGIAVVNPRPKLLEDLDALPAIDHSLFLSLAPGHENVNFHIDVGRGCPFACTYCSTKTFWGRKYRLKSPERIVDEIKDIHQKHGISYFVFDHDMFTMDRKKVVETCRLIKSLPFPITWRCSARADCIDEELIDIMVDAGMVTIFLGIESGSARIQKIINKNLKLDRITQLLSYINSKDIKIIASFVYGFPEETEEDLSLTIGLMGDLAANKRVVITPHLCTFLPGTELTRKYLSQLTPAQNYSNITGGVAVADCQEMINAHPAIFSHFWEYKTPLRDRLAYLEQFIWIWKMQPSVYEYIRRKYAPENLIQMYYDFVDRNRDLLEESDKLPATEGLHYLFQHDHMMELLTDDPYQGVVNDVRNILKTRLFAKDESWQQKTEFYCVSPQDVLNNIPVDQMVQRPYMVTYRKTEDDRITTTINTIGK